MEIISNVGDNNNDSDFNVTDDMMGKYVIKTNENKRYYKEILSDTEKTEMINVPKKKKQKKTVMINVPKKTPKRAKKRTLIETELSMDDNLQFNTTNNAPLLKKRAKKRAKRTQKDTKHKKKKKKTKKETKKEKREKYSGKHKLVLSHLGGVEKVNVSIYWSDSSEDATLCSQCNKHHTMEEPWDPSLASGHRTVEKGCWYKISGNLWRAYANYDSYRQKDAQYHCVGYKQSLGCKLVKYGSLAKHIWSDIAAERIVKTLCKYVKPPNAGCICKGCEKIIFNKKKMNICLEKCAKGFRKLTNQDKLPAFCTK